MKTALVTGASGGIGKAVVEKLAKEKYQIFAHYFRNGESLETLTAEYNHIIPVQADLSSKKGVEILLDQMSAAVDVIVFASGITHYGIIQEVSPEIYDQMIRLHLTAPFFITQRLVANMISKRNGSIIFISSIWGQTGASCETVYSMVKGGQIAFVKALAKELAPSNIRVNAIAPGFIDTKMNAQFSLAERKNIQEEIPMKRMGNPREVADAVVFLAGGGASYITGQVISVNGGWYC